MIRELLPYAFVLALASGSGAQGLNPGREYDAVVPEAELPMKVWVPSNYTVEHSWPLIVYYHGTGGRPTTDRLVHDSAGRDFIIIGMTYSERVPSQRTQAQERAYIEQERKSFRSAVDWAKDRLSLDLKRVYIGGISKGGWTTSLIGEREDSTVAGFIILLAGRQRMLMPAPHNMAGFPVYVGVGEKDPNVFSGLQGVFFYRQCGAIVTYEEFKNMGHAVPEKALRLEQWLEAYGPLSHPWRDADDMKSRKDEYQKAYEEAVALPDAGGSAKALRLLLEDPRLVVVCGDAVVKAIQAKADELTKKDPVARAEWQAEQALSSILWKEWSIHTLDDTRRILNNLKQLSTSYADTRYGDYAESFYKRLLPSYESALKQVEQMKIELKKQ